MNLVGGIWCYAWHSEFFSPVIRMCEDLLVDGFAVRTILEQVLGEVYTSVFEERIKEGAWDSEMETVLREKVSEDCWLFEL